MVSPSTLTWAVVSSTAASFRYDDGKMLNGTGTLASKSRLTEVVEPDLECLSSRYENDSKGRQEETLASGEEGMGVVDFSLDDINS